ENLSHLDLPCRGDQHEQPMFREIGSDQPSRPQTRRATQSNGPETGEAFDERLQSIPFAHLRQIAELVRSIKEQAFAT
ncbi:MAG: hypothetical protein ACREBC_21660, partial [Pyrinomonadaceae bacterium]